MHPDTPAPIKALHETLCFRSHAYERAKEVHGIYSPTACKALAAFDAAQDAFDAAYNEFLRTTKLPEAAPIKPSQEKEVAALRAELAAAQARLDGVAEVLRKPICFPMADDTRRTIIEVLYRNSI